MSWPIAVAVELTAHAFIPTSNIHVSLIAKKPLVVILIQAFEVIIASNVRIDSGTGVIVSPLSIDNVLSSPFR